MRSYALPLRYFLLLLAIIGVMIGAVIVAEILATESIAPDVTIIIKSPFVNTIFEQIFATLVVAVLILIIYSIGYTRLSGGSLMKHPVSPRSGFFL
ncbi:MAG: hypothetical protein WC502_02555 [Methanolinea sp.]|jgi:Mn2+/Fe2+ NRAMP family transporter|nr:hypothetical protein [Methanolinea sp.]